MAKKPMSEKAVMAAIRSKKTTEVMKRGLREYAEKKGWLNESAVEKEVDSKDKFIQKAIKRPGALRKKLKTGKDKTIPVKKLDKTIGALRKKAAKGKLTASQLRELREANLAKTMRTFKKRRKGSLDYHPANRMAMKKEL